MEGQECRTINGVMPGRRTGSLCDLCNQDSGTARGGGRGGGGGVGGGEGRGRGEKG